MRRIVVSDLDSFLNTIEANLGDDALWLVFADWLEEQGDALAPSIRTGVASWVACRHLRGRIFRPLGRHWKRMGACDAVERVLPLFELRYPDETAPRRLLALAREPRIGPAARAVQEEIASAWVGAERDVSRIYPRFLAAWMAIHSARSLVDSPAKTFGSAAFAAVVGQFGAKVGSTPEGEYPPEWTNAFQLEYRWQVARLLRYHFDPARGPS